MTEWRTAPCVIGLEIEKAQALMENDGFRVCKNLVSCRKGAKGENARVVRQREMEDGTVELSYSLFKTVIDNDGN